MPGMDRLLLAAGILLVYGLFCWLCAWHHRRRHANADGDFPLAPGSENATLLVAYASQSGTALELARCVMNSLQIPAQIMSLDRIDDDALAKATDILFVVSTYGEGEPPDNGARFARRYLTASARDLSHLNFAVLALGDRNYQYFCGFGHSIYRSLLSHGAKAYFPMIELDVHDGSDISAGLSRWQQQLRSVNIITRPEALADFASHHGEGLATFSAWQLTNRQQVNPGSPGEPMFLLRLTPVPTAANTHTWQAGDIVEVLPRNAATRCSQWAEYLDLDLNAEVDINGEKSTVAEQLAHRQLPVDPAHWPETCSRPAAECLATLPALHFREYSIASLPDDGALELLIRQQQNEDGSLGIGSGWLTAHAGVGQELELRIRSNPLFRAPTEDVPLILIGNGSGFAGLRAILQAREKAGLHQNWLFFGERHPVADRIFAEELESWQRQQHLSRLNLTFSRCPDTPAYVQDAVLAADELRDWVARGAVIMVCGSRVGMAEGVDRALRQQLGQDCVDQLQAEGRYRRDVY